MPRQDSIRACSTHAVLSGHCNIYLLTRAQTGLSWPACQHPPPDNGDVTPAAVGPAHGRGFRREEGKERKVARRTREKEERGQLKTYVAKPNKYVCSLRSQPHRIVTPMLYINIHMTRNTQTWDNHMRVYVNYFIHNVSRKLTVEIVSPTDFRWPYFYHSIASCYTLCSVQFDVYYGML